MEPAKCHAGKPGIKTTIPYCGKLNRVLSTGQVWAGCNSSVNMNPFLHYDEYPSSTYVEATVTNFDYYGGLYQYSGNMFGLVERCDAKDVDGNGRIDYLGGSASCACPRGWRVPTEDDWEEIHNSDEWDTANAPLTDWFYLPPSGQYYNGVFSGRKSTSYSNYWSATEGSSTSSKSIDA